MSPTDPRDGVLSSLGKALLEMVKGLPAGRVLSALGDPRFREEAWHLAGEPLLGFVEVPAGTFLMGSDPQQDTEAYEDEQPQHPVDLPAYYISRYPVTVAQFRAFVEDSGHEPADEDSLRGADNHPVISVTWTDALAYCGWLTERLAGWPDTPEPLASLLRDRGWKVQLPSEAEWEKAARGADARIYPWDGGASPNLANYDDSGIGATSAVGCFPGGRSAHGCLDMAGNVWEWTRSLWGADLSDPTFTYPYIPSAEREDTSAGREVCRVLRGGAFSNGSRGVRCACRS